jgi:acyl carrier protein
MEVKERVINLLADKLGYEKTEIKETHDIIMDLNADSLDMVEIIMGIEQEFGIHIEDREIQEIRTVGDIIKKVEDIRLGH